MSILKDPRFSSLDTKVLAQVYDVYKGFSSPTDTPYIFLDEIQEVTGWEKWVRTMHELRKAKLIVSGSNAQLLSRELGTLLTGRHIDLTVFPSIVRRVFNVLTKWKSMVLLAFLERRRR